MATHRRIDVSKVGDVTVVKFVDRKILDEAGIQELAGNATLLYYMSEEAKHFMTAQREKRKPDARKYPWLP